LAHASLISIKILCDAGCNVTYDTENGNVNYQGKLLWRGTREKITGMWVLPLNPEHMPTVAPSTPEPTSEHTANSAYDMTSKGALIKYLHQCLFSPPKLTLLRAIENNRFPTWPGLAADAVKKYLPEKLPATDRGHMKRQRKGMRSTKERIKEALDDSEEKKDINPPATVEKQNHMFCYLGKVDKKDGAIYVDLTGNFHLQSMEGMITVFILYDWTTNAILATPISDAKEETMVKHSVRMWHI